MPLDNCQLLAKQFQRWVANRGHEILDVLGYRFQSRLLALDLVCQGSDLFCRVRIETRMPTLCAVYGDKVLNRFLRL